MLAQIRLRLGALTPKTSSRFAMSIAVISPLIVFLLATAWSCELTAAEPRDSPQPAQPADDQFFQATIVPLVEQYCVECHEGDSADAEVALDGLHSVEQILGHREKWERVYRQLGIDGMPPEDHDRRDPVAAAGVEPAHRGKGGEGDQ